MSEAPTSSRVSADFPKKLHCLFQKARYKVLHGGRGGAKSWGIARALVIMGAQNPLTVLCAREFQNSITDSVHKLLKNQIELLGLGDHYRIEQNKIYGINGTEISFEGIKNNPRKIKSYEGVDICWVEEAANVSKESWDLLGPTIRQTKEQHNTPSGRPEIWISFNPDLESDETYKRFVLNPPSNSIVVQISWRDNFWFPEDLRQEMEDLKARDYDDYLHVWEGTTKQVLEGAVYAKELRKAKEDKRLTTAIPYVKIVPVSTFWDLGKQDFTAIWFAQFVNYEIRLIDYYFNQSYDVDHYIQVLQNRGYSYDRHWLPHDAKANKMGQKRTIEQQVRDKLQNVRIVPSGKVYNGIQAARQIFPQCWFDPSRCQDGLQALQHYRYQVVDGQYSREPMHDWASHGADAFRYLAVASKPEKPVVGAKILERVKARFRSPMVSDQASAGQRWMK